MAGQFRQMKRSLAEQFCQIKRSLAEQFRQIKRSLAEQWRFNRKKKHVKGGGLLGLVIRPPLHCQCVDNLRLRSEPLEGKPNFLIRYISFSKSERNFRMGFRQATFYLAELFRQATFYLVELFRQITSPFKIYIVQQR